jgi:hypothetical protein
MCPSVGISHQPTGTLACLVSVCSCLLFVLSLCFLSVRPRCTTCSLNISVDLL